MRMLFWTKAIFGLGAGLLAAAVLRGADVGRRPAARPSPAEPPPGETVAAGPLTVGLHLGNSHVLQGGDGELVVNVDLDAKDLPRKDRRPVNLAIAIDRSGSMAGEKLARAKQAVRGLLDRVTGADRVAVVAYDSDVQVILPSTEAASREQILAAVEAIWPNSDTNLAGGLEAGAAELRRCFREGWTNRVLLLTDGLANRGVTEPAAIAAIARAARQAGIEVSTFGVGADYNERLMLDLADAGGGNYYYIQEAAAIDAAVEKELGRIATITARDVRLRLALGEGVTLSDVYAWKHEREGASVLIPVGDLSSGQRRRVTLRLRVPTGSIGDVQAIASARVDFQDELAGARRSEALGPFAVACSADEAAVSAHVDAGVLNAYGITCAGRALEEASQRYKEGDAKTACAVLERQILALEGDATFAADPSCREQLERARGYLDRLRAEAPASEGGRRLVKEAWDEAYKAQH